VSCFLILLEVILENINGKFDFIAEHTSALTSKVDRLSENMEVLSDKVEVIKADTSIKALEKRRLFGKQSPRVEHNKIILS